MKRKRNPIDATALLSVLKSELADFPYVAGHVSALGGKGRESVLLVVSLQPKSEWKNGILENSTYARFHLGMDGALEHFSGYGLGNMRKTKFKTAGEAAKKIRAFLSARKTNPAGASSRTVTDSSVRSPTRTSTSTEADTKGNITVTGGAGDGNTTVNVRGTRKKNPDQIYTVLKKLGVPLDHHESDLYAKVTPESREIVNAFYHRGDIKTVGTFKSEVDGKMWYEIPFAYLPYWENKQRRKNPVHKATRYWCVDQEQKGLWYQVAHFYSKEKAVAYAHMLADKSGHRARVKRTYPSADTKALHAIKL